MSDLLLVLNAGSSSLKFALYDRFLDLHLKGGISGLSSRPRLKIREAGGAAEQAELGGEPMEMKDAVARVFEALEERGVLRAVVAVGHRIVHGGERWTAPTRLDAAILAELRRLGPLAPLHQPLNLDIVDAAAGLLPGAAQIGCFDTAFHATRPRLERLYGLPRELSEEGLVAYGFHGLSYEYIASVLTERFGPAAGGRTIVAHLGSGVSLCAMKDGRSVATTMGFSPLDGPMMSTRCGALDPGILLHLMREKEMTPDALQTLLYKQSGLLGVSGISGDMQVLLDSDDPRAREAVDLFVLGIARHIGSLAGALGGLDTLVFTAGIGENAPAVREWIGKAASWLGVSVDPDRNTAGDERIAPDGSPVRVLMIPTNEEKAVVRGMVGLL